MKDSRSVDDGKPAEQTNLDELSVRNEALRIKLSFLKFFIGTVALSVLTAALNWQIQTERLEFEIKSKENDFIAKFIDHALDKNPERRRDFAEYFFRLTPTKDSKDRWKQYRDYAVSLVEASIEKQAEIEQRKRELIVASKQAGKGSQGAGQDAEARIDELESALARSRQELASLRSQPSLAFRPRHHWGITSGILTSEQAIRLFKHYGYISGPREDVDPLQFDAAVIQFQGDEGLLVDAIFGAETATALKAKALRDGVFLEGEKEPNQ